MARSMISDSGGTRASTAPKKGTLGAKKLPPVYPTTSRVTGYTAAGKAPAVSKAPVSLGLTGGIGKSMVSSGGGGGGSSSYSGSASSYGGGPVGTSSAGTVAPVQQSVYDMSTADQDNLIRPDQIYNNEVTAYTNALNSLLADLSLEEGEANRGYSKSMTDLGWLGEDQGYNGWDITNPNTAFANSYTNNENDFAARGMYDSSARAEALARLLTNFGDQRTGLTSNLDAQVKDISNRRAAGETTKADSIAMARQNALARYAAGLGVI